MYVCTYGIPTKIWDQNITECKFMCLRISKAKRYRSFRVWSRGRFIAGPCKENGWFMLKKTKLPEGFQQSIFKGKVREGYPRVCDCLVHNSLIGWWWLIPMCQEVWGLHDHDHQVVNFFHLLEVFSIWKTQEICMKYYYLGTSERSYNRGHGGGVSHGKTP